MCGLLLVLPAELAKVWVLPGGAGGQVSPEVWGLRRARGAGGQVSLPAAACAKWSVWVRVRGASLPLSLSPIIACGSRTGTGYMGRMRQQNRNRLHESHAAAEREQATCVACTRRMAYRVLGFRD